MKKLKILNIGWANSIHVERWLRWFAQRGHEISIITDIPKDIEQVKVYDINKRCANKGRLERYKELQFNFYCPLFYNINRIIRLRRIVKKLQPDIIHSHSLWYPGYLGMYLNFHPFVLTVLNGDVLWKKDDISLWGRLRTRLALKKADIVTGVSGELTNACILHGVKKEKTHIIRRGVDLKKFNISKDREMARRQLNLPLESKIVLSPRNLGPSYNLKSIVNMIPKVADKVNNVIFVFIWHSNNDGKELKNFAARLGILEKVKFVGKVDHSKVALYHRSSDIMVSISERDSGPVALQEAMACGDVPVISNFPCVRELISDGHNGFLVDPSDDKQIVAAIVKLLLDDNLRNEMAERNWKIAQDKCDQEKEMKKMETLYYQLICPSCESGRDHARSSRAGRVKDEKKENIGYRQQRNLRCAIG